MSIKIRNLIRLNWMATIRLNYNAGGFRAIFRMPVKVYGRLRLSSLKGKIELPLGAGRNTLIIGSEHEDYTVSAGTAQLCLEGTWRIGGLVRLGPDVFVGIGEKGLLEMGEGTFIGRNTQIHCSRRITFEENVFAGELYASDSTEHQILHQGKEKPLFGEVVVGANSYLGFRTMLLKGCHIPPCSVVASGAIVCSDFRDAGSEKLFLAGVPARIKDNYTQGVKEISAR